MGLAAVRCATIITMARQLFGVGAMPGCQRGSGYLCLYGVDFDTNFRIEMTAPDNSIMLVGVITSTAMIFACNCGILISVILEVALVG